MEYIIWFLQELLRYVGELNPSLFYVAVIGLLIYMIRQGNTDRESVNKRLKEQQEEIVQVRKDYQSGMNEIRKELADIKEITLKELEEGLRENRKLTLRGIITNTTLPIEYRLKSFDDYKSEGGNSWIDNYVVTQLLKEEDKEK